MEQHMSVRSDLESRLKTWADSQNPPIKIAWEGRSFTKPTGGSSWLQPFVLPSYSKNATVDGIRYREQGYWQINIWSVDGKGAGNQESIAQQLINLFPVIPKFSDTSIERVGSMSQGPDNAGYRVLAISWPYRRETQTQ